MEWLPSDHEFLCPHCGALLTQGADHCWKCRREFLQSGASARSPSKPSDSDAAGGEDGDRDEPFPVWKTLGLVAIVALAASVAFFATCLGGVFVSADIGGRGDSEHIYIGLACGTTAALAVIVGLVSRFWPRASIAARDIKPPRNRT